MAKALGYIELTYRIVQEESDLFTAECMELGTAAFGDTFIEAYTAIGAMVELHLNALEDAGECRAFLREHGIPLHRGDPALARQRPPRRVRMRPDVVGVTRERMPILAMA